MPCSRNSQLIATQPENDSYGQSAIVFSLCNCLTVDAGEGGNTLHFIKVRSLPLGGFEGRKGHSRGLQSSLAG